MSTMNNVRYLFLILSVLCAGYYLLIGLYAGFSADFAWIWLVGAAFFMLGWFLFDANVPARLYICRILYGTLLAAGLLFSVVTTGVIVRAARRSVPEDLEYLVVLGAQVKGDEPSRSLRMRLDKALETAQANGSATLILSGGQGSGENITEAECMRRYLVERGIPESRLVMEERSTSTRENLEFSDELTGCAGKKTGVLSNSFHIARALMIAKDVGYRQAYGIAAKSSPVLLLHFTVREEFAMVKAYMKRS